MEGKTFSFMGVQPNKVLWAEERTLIFSAAVRFRRGNEGINRDDIFVTRGGGKE